MTLAPQSRLGPYEITAKIGEGGMGEVSRATDSKLEREVAIKVLPAADGQRFLVLYTTEVKPPPIRVLLNWEEMLER